VVIRDMQSQIRGGSSDARPVRSSVEQSAVKEHQTCATLSRKRCCCCCVVLTLGFLAEGVKRTAQHDPV
jgi:hypothetical protein